MKHTVSTILATLVVIPTLFASSLSLAGAGSGNGDGDGAFALQKLAQDNPGLSPEQILLKAFKESDGRVPEIKYKDLYQSNEANEVFVGNFFDKAEYDGVEFSFHNLDSNPIYVKSAISFRKEVLNLGPLLQRNWNEYYLIQDRRMYGHVSRSQSGLELSGGYDSKNLTRRIELRAYNQNIVLFVQYPLVKPDGEKWCGDLSSQYLDVKLENESKNNGLCSVGYFWIN